VTRPGAVPPAGPPDRQTTGPPGHRATGPPDHQTTGPPGHQATRPPGHQATRPPGHQATRPPGRRAAGPPGRRAAGPPPGRRWSPPGMLTINTSSSDFSCHDSYITPHGTTSRRDLGRRLSRRDLGYSRRSSFGISRRRCPAAPRDVDPGHAASQRSRRSFLGLCLDQERCKIHFGCGQGLQSLGPEMAKLEGVLIPRGHPCVLDVVDNNDGSPCYESVDVDRRQSNTRIAHHHRVCS
jgi:hypothetical protein